MEYKDYINNILSTRGRFNCDGYKERHHIIPKCMGGTNDNDNLIDLYAEEHYIAHKLLALENQDNNKIVYAWWRMNQRRSTNNGVMEVSPEDYAQARKLHSEAMSRRPITDETRRKFSEKIKGKNNPMYGMCGSKNPCYGRKHTQAERKKMRKNHVDMSGKNNPMYGLRGDKSPHAKGVYCIELDKAFGSIKSAAQYVGVHQGCISACLRGKQKAAGRHPVTKEKLHWMLQKEVI